MRKKATIAVTAALLLMLGLGSAALGTHATNVEYHTIPYSFGTVSGAFTVTDTDTVPHAETTVTETVTVTSSTTTAPTTDTTTTEPPPPPSETCSRYASPSGDDTSTGTFEAPFRTPQKLMDSLAAGETGCLRGGEYSSGLQVNGGGTAGSPITLRSYPGERARIVGNVYVPNDSPNITFDELDIEGTGDITLKIVAANVTVEDSDITNKHRGTSCMILGVAGFGRAVNPIVRRNVIHECGTSARAHLDHGVYAAQVDGGLITHNVFWSITGFIIQFYPNAQGLTFSWNVSDGDLPSVEGGVIFAGEGSQASSNNVVENNVIAHAQSYNVEAYWGGTVGSGNVARHNCLWQGRSGNVDSQNGFTATDNLVTDPLFENRAARDYRLRPGPCLNFLGSQPGP